MKQILKWKKNKEVKNVCGLRHLFVDFICLVGNGFEKFDLEKIFRMCISHAPKLMGRLQV